MQKLKTNLTYIFQMKLFIIAIRVDKKMTGQTEDTYFIEPTH